MVSVSFVAAAPTPPLTPDIPKEIKPSEMANFEKRDVMIAMRDGVKLHTVILVPKSAKRAPILLTRTPYNASERAGHPDLELAQTFVENIFFAKSGDYQKATQRVYHQPKAATALELPIVAN